MPKTLTIITLILLISIKAVCQPYNSMFGADSTRWTVLAGDGHVDTYYDYHYEKDTIVGGVTYRDVKSSFANLLFKEDLNQGKVWYRLVGCDTSDLEFMDYTLQKGDTFRVMPFVRDSVSTVDTTFVLNNRKHVRFFGKIYSILSGPEPLEFVEGVGYNFGLLSHVNTNCPQSATRDMYLTCAYQDGVQIYYNKAVTACDFVSVTNILQKSEISIFPNPAKDVITLKLGDGNNTYLTYSIINILGQNLSEQRLRSNNNTVQIDISKLPSGAYILKANTAEHSISKAFYKQ